MTYQIGQIEFVNQGAWDRKVIHAIGAHSGHPRWHALNVLPQKEAAVEAWLHLRGVYSFHPVRPRVSIIRGQRIERNERYLPGYVFARFPSRAIIGRVTNCPMISGAITMRSGAWGILHPDDIRKLHSMRAMDDAGAKAKSDKMRIAKGDKVKILEGLWSEGQQVEVLEIKAGKARFMVRMFGTDVPGEAALDQIRKVV